MVDFFDGSSTNYSVVFLQKNIRLKEIELKHQQLQQSNKTLTDEFSRK
jgi:hypothetical protein